MYWNIHPQLTACIASGRLILLDIACDRYFAVPGDASEAAIAWLRAGDGSAAPKELLALLGKSQGLTNLDCTPVLIPTAMAPPARSRCAIGSGPSVIVAVAATKVALRSRKLSNILDQRLRSRRVGPTEDDATLQDRAELFAAARRWCPIRANCLLDSLAFDCWLGSPTKVRIVFGVLGRPFEAHCWVQSNTAVLNDSYDRVSRFEPILSL